MKNRFEGDLEVRVLLAVKGKAFLVLKPFYYQAKNGTWYKIPKDLRTDFASVPPVLRNIISRTGKYNYAAVLHDWLCEYKIVERKKADKLFLEAMKCLGVGWLKRRTMYAAVRVYSTYIDVKAYSIQLFKNKPW